MEKLLADEEMRNLMISSVEDLEKSNMIRINGNAFYKVGKLEEAIKMYHKANRAAPSNSLPLYNLSAVYFEKGDHGNCVEYLEKAMKCPGDSVAVREKASSRLMKSLLHMHKWEDARVLCEYGLNGKEEKKMYGEIIDQAKCVWTEWSINGGLNESQLSDSEASDQSYKDAISRLSLSLPRYKVAIINPPLDYYGIGHDSAKSLFSEDHQTSTKASNLLFAGTGDGRNFYVTLISVAKHEMQSNEAQSFHILINDINPYALTRIIIVLSLAEELAELGEAEGLKRLLVLATLYYVLVGVAMPPSVFEHLKLTMDKIAKDLQDSNHLFRVDVTSCRSEITKCLLSWQNFDMNAVPVSEILLYHCDTQEPSEGFSGPNEEHQIWMQTGMLLPPAVLKRDELELNEMLQNMEPRPEKSQIKRLKGYIADNWKPNPTMVDFGWLERNQIQKLDLQWNPFGIVKDFYGNSGIKKPSDGSPLFEQFLPFLENLAKAWEGLRRKLTVEALVGDVVQIAESIHHSTLDRPKGYPKLFDRIHLSNIPDYVGGVLATGIFFSRLVAPGPENFVTTCLKNPGVWESIAQYHDEYALIEKPENLGKLLQIQHSSQRSSMSESSFMGSPPLHECQFWYRLSSKPHPYSDLLAREELKRWLFALFFKICVPVDQTATPWTSMILPTLNISIYFRVLMHLHQIGYPSHWLAEILAAIIDNKVVSSARQFHTCPLETSELTKKYPPKKLSTTPYIPEMATLTVLFQRILPFSVLADLPSPKTVYRYSIKISIDWQGTHHGIDSYPKNNAILVFYRSSLMNRLDQNNQLDKLLDPVLNRKDVAKLYNEGLMVITTWEWDTLSLTGRFWMASEKIERLFSGDANDWKAGAWGTILWERMHKRPANVVNNLKKEEAWFA